MKKYNRDEMNEDLKKAGFTPITPDYPVKIVSVDRLQAGRLHPAPPDIHKMYFDLVERHVKLSEKYAELADKYLQLMEKKASKSGTV